MCPTTLVWVHLAWEAAPAWAEVGEWAVVWAEAAAEAWVEVVVEVWVEAVVWGEERACNESNSEVKLCLKEMEPDPRAVRRREVDV